MVTFGGLRIKLDVNVIRTGHAHQVSAVALKLLQREAFLGT